MDARTPHTPSPAVAIPGGSYRPWQLALLTCLVSGIVLLIILLQVRANHLEEQRYQLLQQLSTYGAELRGKVETAAVILDSLKIDIQLNPDNDLEKLADRLSLVMRSENPYRHLALAPDLIIRLVYPLAGNEAAIGTDYRRIPAQYRGIQTAIRERSAVLAGPVELVQGGQALIFRVAVFTGQQQRTLWGIIAGVIELGTLLSMSGLDDFNTDYRLALSGIDGDPADKTVFWGDQSLLQQRPVRVTVSLPTGSWQLAALPRQPWPLPTRFWLITTLGLAIVFSLGGTVFWIATLQRQRENSMFQLAHQAQHDALTGLPNRQHLGQVLNACLEQAEEGHVRLGLLCMDLDEFKQVNISLGHATGDRLIQIIGERLRGATASFHFLAYLGADEFAVVVGRVVDRNELEALARELIARINQPIELPLNELRISASVGIALYPDDGTNEVDLIKHADRAMYAAKSAGRDTFAFYTADMQREADSYVQLHNDIVKGIERQEFMLVYQPILDVRQNQFTKCEALIRWQHPQRGLISPIHFIPVAERTGAIRALGDWVLQQALHDLGILRDRGINLQVSINRSSHEFNVPEVAEKWLATIHHNKRVPGDIIFEITESLFMDSLITQQNNIRCLHNQGIAFAIDDFGTGYSALNYLRRYPLELIKIDKSFIEPLQQGAPTASLAAVFVNMARALRLGAVAEGVETEQQFNALVKLQCDFLQGYYLSRPLPLDDLIHFVSTSSAS